MKCKFLSAVILSFVVTHCIGQSIDQQIINTTGNSFQKEHFTVDWSIGEATIINTMQSADDQLALTNGFIQPLTNLLNIATANMPFKKEEIKILPNPTRDIVEINFLTNQHGTARLQFYNSMGQLLLTKDFNLYGYGQVQKIDIRNFKAGYYNLRIQVQSFWTNKVIKRSVYQVIKI